MIIEVDEITGQATTYKTFGEFTFAHRDELDKQYEKRYTPVPLIHIDFVDRLQDMLPEGTSKITKIHEHTNYIVVNCENGEIHSFDRIGEYPWFQFRK